MSRKPRAAEPKTTTPKNHSHFICKHAKKAVTLITDMSREEQYQQAEALLNRVLHRAAKHQLPWDRKQAKIDAMHAILLSWAANYTDCMASLKDHAEI